MILVPMLLFFGGIASLLYVYLVAIPANLYLIHVLGDRLANQVEFMEAPIVVWRMWRMWRQRRWFPRARIVRLGRTGSRRL